MRPYTRARRKQPPTKLELPLDAWLHIILKIANSLDKENPSRKNLSRMLDRLIEGTLPGRLARKFAWSLPPILFSFDGDGLRLKIDLQPGTVEEWEDEGLFLGTVAADHAEELEAVIYALSVDPLGTRVRRCDYCWEFFVARRNHRRQRHFCCEKHRREADHLLRDPQRQAAYMRQYRTIRNRRR